MKHIYVNLKRFDIPVELGGVNRLAPPSEWVEHIMDEVVPGLESYDSARARFTMFLPEAYVLAAVALGGASSSVRIGVQSVHHSDVEPGGNFGAFTGQRTATAAAALGAQSALIGHSEERRDKRDLLGRVRPGDKVAIDRAIHALLNEQMQRALNAGLDVLYCIGEEAEDVDEWQEVLETQLTLGLNGIDPSRVTLAYEPAWAIGPGKTPPGTDYIREVAQHVKNILPGMEIVYGGGLKQDNAKLLASVEELDGGLVALTRFTGDIGFYPDEFLEIVRLYLGATD